MPKTPSAPLSINRRLVYASLALTLAFALLISCLLSVQLYQLADRHRNAIGEALMAHLVDSVRQPLSHRDAIQLQVVLDNLVSQNPAIAQVSVSDAEGRLHARKARDGVATDDAVSFSSPVILPDGSKESARLDLLASTLTTGYFTPVWSAVALWLFTAIGFLVWSARFGHQLSSRLRHLCRGLSSITDETGEDELRVLEKRIAPLLINAAPTTTHRPPTHIDKRHDSCTLAIQCLNLQRLKSQLNRDSFRGMLAGIDNLLTRALQLYGGQRRSGSGSWIFARFAATVESDDHTLRALSCAHALFALSREQSFAGGIRCELAAVLGPLPAAEQGSQLLSDFLEGEHQRQLAQAAGGVKPSQILVLATLSERLAGTANVVPLPNQDEVMLFESFVESRQSIADQQIGYLRACHRN